jgi:hypothetical protein
VPVEEAMRRLLVMHDTADQVASIERGNATKLAGVSFVNRGEFALRVHANGQLNVPTELRRRGRPMTVGRARRDLAATNRAARVGVSDAAVASAEAAIAADAAVPVRVHSSARMNRGQLQSELQRQRARLEALPNFEFATLDESIGGVLVMLNGDPATQQAAKPMWEQSCPFPSQSILRLVVSRIQQFTGDDDERVGPQLVYDGFSAIRNSDSKSGVITAAHCNSANQISIRDSGERHTI